MNATTQHRAGRVAQLPFRIGLTNLHRLGSPGLQKRHGAPRLGPVGLASRAFLDRHLCSAGVEPTAEILAGAERLAELIETLLGNVGAAVMAPGLGPVGADDPVRYAAAVDTIRVLVRDALDSIGVVRSAAIAGDRLELWLSLVICHGLPADILDAPAG